MSARLNVYCGYYRSDRENDENIERAKKNNREMVSKCCGVSREAEGNNVSCVKEQVSSRATGPKTS